MYNEADFVSASTPSRFVSSPIGPSSLRNSCARSPMLLQLAQRVHALARTSDGMLAQCGRDGWPTAAARARRKRGCQETCNSSANSTTEGQRRGQAHQVGSPRPLLARRQVLASPCHHQEAVSLTSVQSGNCHTDLAPSFGILPTQLPSKPL